MRYYDLEQISRESIEETRSLGEGTTLRYLRASHIQRTRSPSRGSAPPPANPTETGLPRASYFAKALEQELHRVRRYVEIFCEEIWVQLGTIVESLAKVATPRAAGDTLSTQQLQALTSQCHEIGNDIVLLDEFLRQNVVACAHLAQKHDAVAFTTQSKAEALHELKDPSLQYIQAMEQTLISAVENGTILVNLSDIYCQIRQLHTGDGWYTPKAEDAMSHSMKFWVHPGDVLKLKCELVKHLQISTYERDMSMGGRYGKKLSFLKDESLQEWHQVKSLYFDDMALSNYAAWMAEGGDGSVVRASTHGGNWLGHEQTVYVEKRFKDSKKGHNPDTKQLVGVSMSDFGKFLAGKHVTPVQGEHLQSEWLMSFQKRLANRQEIPQLWAENRRTVFEEGYSSDVMMSLDTHVRFIREGPTKGKVSNPFIDMHPKPFQESIHHFPYAILEMELASEITPSWVQELLDTSLLVMVPNFSKYVHGTAVLFPDKVKTYPEWFLQNPEGNFVSGTLDQVAEVFNQGDFEEEISLRPITRRITTASERSAGVQVSTLVQDGNSDVLSHVVVMHNGPSPSVDRSEVGLRRSFKSNGRSRDNDSAKESLSGGASDEADTTEGRSMKLGPWAPSRKKTKTEDDMLANENKSPPLPKAAALVRTRIEPKTFFANERTFLSWLSIAVLVMFMGLSLLGGHKLGGGSVSEDKQHSSQESRAIGAAHISGALISPISILLLVYALLVYRRRSTQILRRETVRYDDQKGPILITVLLIIVLVMAYGFSLKAAFGEEKLEASPVSLNL